MTVFDLRDADIIERLQRMRTHYCTGPCGQSSAVMDARSETESVINVLMKSDMRVAAVWGEPQEVVDFLYSFQTRIYSNWRDSKAMWKAMRNTEEYIYENGGLFCFQLYWNESLGEFISECNARGVRIRLRKERRPYREPS